ncbi:5-formyltetrahydrofolate cyclo-ligase [Orenia marismortui]|uniref:5-formyltetrahydrofolate cyclo-ligase n=1 Tax=Orenia marismortui TaxID=46469 RepID=A0A4R8GQC5_9FIRM|nr:5-formyltetrahydrofolate cyclo-ligase [Orenia marismortui]TDX47995.1 5-formyltetrahydrofolate cyclo-ligase [Orenia marismortui]
MKISKKEQRDRILFLRKNMYNKDIEEKSIEVKNKLFALEEFDSAQSIMLYVAFRNEVRTETMIKDCLDMGKKVIVPVTDIDNRELYLSELKDYDLELTQGSYGILEPESNYIRIVDLSEVDLVVLPGLAFDKRGNRLGYGGGYYDKLLAKNSNLTKIAICFDFQIIANVVFDNHDIKMDKIISEEQVIVCSS